MAVVSGLVCYPVKGCAGVTLEHSDVTPTGLAHDRTYAVIDPSGATTIWQGVTPGLATIRPRVVADGVVLSAPGQEDLTVATATDGQTFAVDVDRWPGRGIDQGDTAAEWLSDLLGVAVRLVRKPPTPGPDPTAVLITSESSLDNLNTRIASRGAAGVPMNRFRPNVIITGWPEPHTEDRAARMTAGTAEFGFGERAVRCVITMIDQRTGTRAGPEPLRTLADYRREPDGVTFGMKASVHTPGHITVGDEVTITEPMPTPVSAQ